MYYYSFHIGDYRAATAHLTNEEDLAYRRLIDMYYDSESCIPLDTHWVSRRIRVAIEVVETVLKDMFEHTENGWRLQRCEDEIATYQHNAEVNRTNGKLGGRPKKTQSVTDGLPTETESKPNQKATINHKPETINQEPIKNIRAPRFDAVQHLVSLGVIEQVAKDYCQQRKKKPTMTAIEGIHKQAIKAGISLNKALEICCARGWEGFKADWVKDKAQSQQLTPYQQSMKSASISIFGNLENLNDSRIIDISPVAGRLDSKDI